MMGTLQIYVGWAKRSVPTIIYSVSDKSFGAFYQMIYLKHYF